MSGKGYRDLLAWSKAMDLTEEIYKTTGGFPSEEKYGLTSQMRRASVSIPSNIAEGSGRNTTKDFKNFLGIAKGSTLELQTQIEIANRLAYLSKVQVELLTLKSDEVGRILNGLMKSLDRKTLTPNTND